jgi:hypothetical protein
VVTVTLAGPVVALDAMLNVALIREVLTTLTLLTVMPGLSVAGFAPGAKLDPVRVTGTVAPRVPDGGLINEIATPVPACSIEKDWSTIETDPVNVPDPVLLGIEKFTAPTPVPDVGDVIVIHGALLTAFHEHSCDVLTCMVPEDGDEPKN